MNQEIDDLQNKISRLSGRVYKIEEELQFNSDFRKGRDLEIEKQALRVQLGHCYRELAQNTRLSAGVVSCE
jgi:predicted  nucleic acid-binding Zn-ribbon protein